MTLSSDAGAGTDVIEHAHFAPWCWCAADGAAVIDEEVREIRPFRAVDQRHQIRLDLFRLRVLRQPEPAADAAHVRVDDHTDVAVERITEHDVRGLAADAGQFRSEEHTSELQSQSNL